MDGDPAGVAGVDRFGGEEPLTVLGVVIGRPGTLLDFGFRFLDRLAHLAADRRRQLLAEGTQLTRDAGHQLGAGRPGSRPVTPPGGVGGVERAVDLRVVEDLVSLERLTVGRVDRLDHRT